MYITFIRLHLDKNFENKETFIRYYKRYRYQVTFLLYDYYIFSTQFKQEFVIQFQDVIDTKNISYKTLSEEFIIACKDKLNMYQVSASARLSENFIIRFQHLLSWNHTFSNQNLSSKFIARFYKFLTPEEISNRKMFDKKFRKVLNTNK